MTQEAVQFHISKGDYFGTLATALDLYCQMEGKQSDEAKEQFFNAIRDELMFLQEHYRIVVIAEEGLSLSKSTSPSPNLRA